MVVSVERDMVNAVKSPLINGNEAAFIYKGKAENVYLVGDYNKWELEDSMIKLQGSDVWYIIKNFDTNSRFEYKFVVDGNWIKDPLNEIETGNSGNSTLIMPEYRSDYESIMAKAVPKGVLQNDLKFYSRYMGTEMQYHIYLPPGHEAEKTNHILYALDGSDYLNFSKINLIFDFMIHSSQIPDLVAVLADPHDRSTDYTIHEPYYDYIVRELMPYVENKYVGKSTEIDRSVIGVSWGGLTAIYLAVNTPGSFKRVLSQSGSFWPRDWLIFDIIEASSIPTVRFCLQAGTVQDTEEMNDAMAGLLQGKGHPVDYVKYAETHNWSNWTGHLNEGLLSIFSK